jgi:hypothetical protein
MTLAGWTRVAAGARLVASAASKQASDKTAVVAGRATNHGMDLSSKVRASSQELLNRMAVTNLNSPGDETMSSSSSGTSPYESQLHSQTIHKYGKVKISVSATEPNHPHLLHADQEREKKTTNEVIMNHYLLHANKSAILQSATSVKEEKEQQVPSEKPEREETAYISNDQTGQNNSASFENTITAENQINNPQAVHDVHEEGTGPRLKEGRAIPSSRVGRALGFASLGVGLAFGTASEMASRLLGASSSSSDSSVMTTDANADRLAATLCRMRGAALKMGQMLSIQDESLLPPALSRALHQVRQGADAMPNHQLVKQLVSQLGRDWRDKFESFDEIPFAAASIG